MASYPIRDQVAIVGIGSTGFRTDTGTTSQLGFATDAAMAAIKDAGMEVGDIDGLCGTFPEARVVASTLGLPEVVWHANQPPPIGFSIIDAMNAIYAGLCDAVLVYHSMYRPPAWSRAAAHDPFRRFVRFGAPPPGIRHDPDDVAGALGYASWASRYMHLYGVDKQEFGLVAINGRTNAAANPLAVRREALSMDDYLSARMVREPLCLYDLDIPVDGGDAFVLTSADRARDLPHPPVLLHAATAGLIDRNEEDQIPGLDRHGHHVVARSLRDKSELWLSDADVFFPYDGYTIIALSWIEAMGWCGPGEAGSFLRDHWSKREARVLVGGRVPMNPHGGGLSEGGTQGSGHVREAVVQLRGDAGARQVADAATAILAIGGLFFNAQGFVLRRGDR